jgi:hypothetical protein
VGPKCVCVERGFAEFIHTGNCIFVCDNYIKEMYKGSCVSFHV